MVGLTRCAAVDIKRNAEFSKRVLNHLVIAVDHILWGDTFLAGTNGNGYTVFVRASDK